MKTGIIGLGAMGTGIAKNLQQAGQLSCAWNRTKARILDFSEQHGITLADSPEALAENCDLIFIAVSADSDVLSIIDQIKGHLRAGSIVVDTSTVSSATAQQAADILQKKDVQFLDAPVTGGSEGAQNGTLAMMVGGDADALTRATPILNTFTSRIVHMGATGSGQAAKAVNQIMCAGINQAVTEALAFGEAQGLDMQRVIQVVSQGAAGNWFLDHRGTSMLNGTFTPGFKLALHHKDLKICQQMAAEKNAVLPTLELTISQYADLLAKGHGEEDISTLFHNKQELFTPNV